MKPRPLPPPRRIVQAIVVVGLLGGAVAWAIARAITGSHAAWIALFALAAIIAWAIDAFVPWMGATAVVKGPRAPRGSSPRVALTFDDGPSADTPAVLAALAREQIRATFFVLGRHAEQHPELVRSIAAAGHEVGNHTWTHQVLPFRSQHAIEAEVDQTQALLTRLVGRAPRLFRAPRGWQGPLVRAVLQSRHLRLIAWTRGAWDSERRPAEAIADLAAARPRDGDILLLHDGAGTPGEQRRDRTAEAVPLIIAAYRRLGFRFVTVPELLESARA